MLKEMLPILMVDDDKDDRFLIEKAFKKNMVANPMVFLHDGEELMNYLLRKNGYEDRNSSTKPCFILLDLNMPKMDGRKALELIKSDPGLKNIPVVMFTTSPAQEDVVRCYDLGANSFITKPLDYLGLVSLMDSLKKYWLETVVLPPQHAS